MNLETLKGEVERLKNSVRAAYDCAYDTELSIISSKHKFESVIISDKSIDDGILSQCKDLVSTIGDNLQDIININWDSVMSQISEESVNVSQEGNVGETTDNVSEKDNESSKIKKGINKKPTLDAGLNYTYQG